MIISGKDISGNQTIRTEAIVIGSGAGGAVVARELAEEGVDVAIFEEGPYVSPDEYTRFRPTQVMRKMGRGAATTAAIPIGDTPTINIMAGSCVGGSSVWTGGVCFRIPGTVHRQWQQGLGLSALSEAEMVPHYERVEQMSHVEEVPANMRPQGTVRFGEGAAKLGWPLTPLRRNTKGCRGCSRCNFGCPHKAKMSVDLTYLPRARELGARIYADHRVDRLLIEGDRVVGISGRVLNGPGRTPKDRFTVRAEVVVVAAGTLHTPLVLHASKVGKKSRQLGRNLTLHPSFRLGAVFDDEMFPWKGALQSAFSNHFEDEGIILVSAAAPVSMLAAAFPGVGPEFMRRTGQMPFLGTFGGMVHDGPGGRVRPGFGREPLITYRMARQDKERVVRGIQIIAEAFLAAGARQLLMPIFGLPPLENMDDVRRHVTPDITATRIECMSFHPLGTCRIGVDPARSVVRQTGQVHGIDNLWVADGSIFPTSVGVNTQLPIMAMATRIATEINAVRRTSGFREARTRRPLWRRVLKGAMGSR